MTAKKSDVTTFRGAFESVMRQHYPSLVGHVVVKLVSCPSVCTDALGILSRFVYMFICLLVHFIHHSLTPHTRHEFM